MFRTAGVTRISTFWSIEWYTQCTLPTAHSVPENTILFKKMKSRFWLNNKKPENMYRTKKLLRIWAEFYIYAYSPVFVVFTFSVDVRRNKVKTGYIIGCTNKDLGLF